MIWPAYLGVRGKTKNDISGSIMFRPKDLKDKNLLLTQRFMTPISSMISLTLYLVIMFQCMGLNTGELR